MVLFVPSTKRAQQVAVLVLAVSGLISLSGCGLQSAASYIERGDKYFAQGKFADAELAYRKAIQKEMRLGSTHYKLALAQLKQAKINQAANSLQRAILLDPHDIPSKVTLADVYVSAYAADPSHPQPLYDNAAKLCQDLAKARPEDYDILRLNGQLAAAVGKQEEALAQLNRANSLKPLEPAVVMPLVSVLLAAERFEEAEKLTRDALERHKTFTPLYDMLYSRYLATKRIAEGEALLKSKAANNPADAGAILQLAAHLAGTNKEAEASAALKGLLDRPKEFPRAHLQVGDFYASIGRFDEAITNYEQGARLNPKEKLPYHRNIVSALLAQGKADRAVELLDGFIRENPGEAELRATRASLWLRTGSAEKLDAAIAEYRALLQEDPGNPSLRFSLGRALIGRRKPEAARAEFRQAINHQKSFVPAKLALAEMSLVENKFDEALKYAEDALSFGENPGAQLLRASALAGSGKVEIARVQLNQLIKEFPNLRQAQLQLAFIDLAEGKVKHAEEVFRSFYQPGSGDVSAIRGLVEAHLAQNRPADAMKLLQEELKRSPNQLELELLIASTAQRSGDSKVAAEHYRELIGKYPESDDLHFQLGNSLFNAGDVEAARASLQKAAALAPSEVRYQLALGSLLEFMGRRTEAQSFYQAALKLNPDNPFLLNNTAFNLVETNGNLDEALRCIQRALREMPEQPNFADTLAWIYAKKQMHESALQILTNLTKKYPDTATFRYHLGTVLAQKGETDKAKRELQIALLKKPQKEEETQIRQLMERLNR